MIDKIYYFVGFGFVWLVILLTIFYWIKLFFEWNQRKRTWVYQFYDAIDSYFKIYSKYSKEYFKNDTEKIEDAIECCDYMKKYLEHKNNRDLKFLKAWHIEKIKELSAKLKSNE